MMAKLKTRERKWQNVIVKVELSFQRVVSLF